MRSYYIIYFSGSASLSSIPTALQPVTYMGDQYREVLRIPFRHDYGASSYDEVAFSESSRDYFTYQIIFDPENIQLQFIANQGLDTILGVDPEYPTVTTGMRASAYNHGDMDEGASVSKYLYSDHLIESANQSSWCSYSFQFYKKVRYQLLSDNYPNWPQSITYLSIDSGPMAPTFNEIDMSGNLIWSDSLSYLDEEVLISGICESSCFRGNNNEPYTIYFAPGTGAWEVRNRLSGSIDGHGEAPFVPANIERIGDNTLIFLAADSLGVEVWYGSYTVGVNDPCQIPAPQLTAKCYPNPFNPETTISYSIPEKGTVEIDVYNVRGQKVASLLHETQDAGEHEVVWDANDQASGIYFIRLRTAGETRINKALLLK